MSAIRSVHLLRRTVGLAAVPTLLLTVAACGGDDGGGNSSFCDAANEVDETFDSVDDPASAEYRAAIDQLEALDPPAEIADDWDLMVEMLGRLTEIDVNDPEATAGLNLDEADAAADRVATYLEEECGIETE
jgi:hypothetical protein